jgi:hypothetical protein
VKSPIRKRPTSVTMMSWVLIAMGGISLLAIFSRVGNAQAAAPIAHGPIAIAAQYAVSFGSLLVPIVSGAAMLNGKSWGRLLYTIWSGVALINGIVASPSRLLMIPSGLVYLIFVVLLFQPNANRFFAATKASSQGEGA